MEDNLLFANNRKEFIQEFLAAMEKMSCKIQIDVANSGLEAAKLLRKKRYKIVVTGMHLSTFGGAKLIAYLNEHFPQTVCIVYTRRMEPAYLKLLVNELRVFRIFQKPADYQKLYDSIQEGLHLYEKGENMRMERQQIDQGIRRASLRIAELEQSIQDQPREKEDFVRFLQGMLKTFQKDVKSVLSKEEKEQVLRYERRILLWLIREQEHVMAQGQEAAYGQEPAQDAEAAYGQEIMQGQPAQVSQGILKEFHHPEQQQEVEISMDGFTGRILPENHLRLVFALYLVIMRLSGLADTYRIKASIAPGENGHFQVEVESGLSESVWQKKHGDLAEQAITNVSHGILERVTEKFSKAFQEGKVAYHLEL